jgi:hypothetical protein
MPADPRLAAVQAALRAAAAKALEVMGRDEVIRLTVAALATADLTPRELAGEARRSRRDAMAAELARLGGGRDAPMLVAKKFAVDARDPVELANLARSVRRLRKKSDLVRTAPLKSIRG